MRENSWLQSATPAFRLMIATSWLAPASWQEHQEKAIREAIGAGVDWMEYLRLVDRHRTPALSWAALKRVPGLEIPQPARRELQKRSDACRMQAVRHSLMLAEVLRGFNRAGIPVMPLKGPLLSLELYGDVGLRQSKDLDLACTKEDIPRAQACLE
ncbi:MAG: nucleotidyltransferase family protein, partial [Terracidiphilus sp.]